MMSQPTEGVSLKLYKPNTDVDLAFGPFLQEFYTHAEATSSESTTAFVAMFSPDVKFVLGGETLFSGKEGAAKFKVAITKGNSFSHFPRTAEVVQSNTTPTTKTFRVHGSAKEILPNGKCVLNDYITQWHILTRPDGKPFIDPAVDSIFQLDLISQTPSVEDWGSY